MRCFSKLLLLFLLLPFAAHGQTTSVSATITDAGGQAWSYGNFSFSFVPAPINPQGPYRFQGAAFNVNQVVSGSLDASGSFAGALVPDNTFITPSGSAWLFKACPASTTSCFTKVFTISGASQSLTASFTPPAIVLDLGSPPPNGASAYTDSEVTNGRPGSLYYSITMNTLRFCQITPFPPCTWTSNSGSGTVTSFSAGNLSPLFTTSVATATTTPALSFTLSNAAANTFLGNCTGSPAPPTFCTPTFSTIPFSGITGATNTTATMHVGSGALLDFTGTGIINATTAISASTAANMPFSGLTSGGNTTAAMVVNTGATLDFAGTGTINATKINGVTVTGTPGVGNVPTATGATTATWQTPNTGQGVQTFVDKPQAGNVTITSAATTITSQAITMPASGCPCRVMYSFSVYLSFAGAVNQNNIDVWVSDGTNNFRGVETGQSNAATGAATSAAYTGWSTVTYSNGATITFTLRGQLPGSTALAQAAVSTGAGPNAGLTLAAFASN